MVEVLKNKMKTTEILMPAVVEEMREEPAAVDVVPGMAAMAAGSVLGQAGAVGVGTTPKTMWSMKQSTLMVGR